MRLARNEVGHIYYIYRYCGKCIFFNFLQKKSVTMFFNSQRVAIFALDFPSLEEYGMSNVL